MLNREVRLLCKWSLWKKYLNYHVMVGLSFFNVTYVVFDITDIQLQTILLSNINGHAKQEYLLTRGTLWCPRTSYNVGQWHHHISENEPMSQVRFMTFYLPCHYDIHISVMLVNDIIVSLKTNQCPIWVMCHFTVHKTSHISDVGQWHHHIAKNFPISHVRHVTFCFLMSLMYFLARWMLLMVCRIECLYLTSIIT